MNKIIYIRTAVIILISIVLVLFSLFFVYRSGFALVIIPLLITAVFAFPFLLVKKIDLFSVWSFLFYSVFFGVLCRCIYIYFDIPNKSKIDEVFLLNKDKSFLIPSMFLMFFGSISMVIGFIFPRRKKTFNKKIFKYDHWNERKFFILTTSIACLSLIALIKFIALQGGLFSLSSISNYRGISTNLSETKSYSYLRVIISLSGVNFLLLYSWLFNYRTKRIFASVLLVASFIIYVFFNIYVSQRAAVFFTFINIIALSYYFNGSKFSQRKFLLAIIPALLIFQLMSALRKDNNLLYQQGFNFRFLKSLEPAILTTNMVDVSKTAHIIQAIPEKIDYQYGYTFTTALFAWIPRSFWKNKPVTNFDNIIGMEVFDAKTYGSGGVPPGIFAELYWNFWIPGVLLGCMLVGMYLKVIHLTFKYYHSNKNSILIYVTVFMMNGVWLVGSSFTSTLIGLLTTLIPLWWMLNFITVPTFRILNQKL